MPSSSEIEPILGIQFSIFSPDEIERRSVVEITSNNTYEGNEPKIGGLFDPRMGVLENGKQCRSCGQSNNNCPGHFGHYRLGRPVYYIQFLPMILNVLSCVCVSCSKLLVDKEMRTSIRLKKGEGRWKELLEASGNISRCGQETEDGCGSRQPDRYKREGIARIVAEWDAIDGKEVKHDAMKQPLEVEYVQRLFRRVTDEDVAFMGFNPRWCRPDWMICSVLAIPPPQVRPSVVQENNQRSEDDLTHKLFEIIKYNKLLLAKMDAEGSKANKGYVDELTNVLQYHIATLVDNQIPGVAPSAQRGGRPLKSIQQRLGSKEGRIRYNLQGKRVEFSARSVITPDPNISIAELGVPIKIAMNLTVPERVTDYNRDKMYKLVQNGTTKYPGAKTLVRADGRMISLAHVKTEEIVLYNGDLVNRHLLDGDMVLFNRQPTLHRMSMMGHRVRVLPYNTFRLNVSAVAPYNADFDGDEMNAHIPQSSEAIQELQDIAAVPYQMISPRHQKPVIKVVQDALLGSYRITKQGETFTKKEYMNLMMWNKRFDGKMPEPTSTTGTARWSGQQVLGSLLPPINSDLKNKFYDDDSTPNNMVKLRDGMIQGSGIVDDDILNKTGIGIVHTTYNDFGAQAAVDLIDSVQSTIESYLIMSGFSVGLSDLVADDSTLSTMNDIVQARKKEIDEIVLQVHMDLFDNNTGRSNQDEFEGQVFGKLNKAIEELGKLGQKALAQENRLISMLKAGSKGSTINVSQMVACVGQQNIEGRRIPFGFTDRTLPHYKKFDDGAEARGFVENSFVKGLTPQEFFFHAMSGREGLIDTAVKTAETGYIQRQMVKAMEDLVTQHDGTVRDARGGIVQFHYGEDGISCTKVESMGLPIHSMSDQEIRTQVGLAGEKWEEILDETVLGERKEDAELLNSFVDKVIADRNMLVNGVFRNGRAKSLMGPMNLDRMIVNLKIKFGIKANGKTDLLPEYVIEQVAKLQERTLPFHKMWGAMLRYQLGPHSSIVKHRLTKLAFNALVEQIILKNWSSIAQPGEQVGIIAAQSIGEPATQMSCIGSSFVIIEQNGSLYSGPIGDFIDKLLNENKENVQTIGHESVVMDMDSKSPMKIIGVSADEKTSWRQISQISRHPANGGLVEVHTRSGRKTTATLTHSFLKRSTNGIVPVLGSDLKVGMRIPVASSIPTCKNPQLTVKQGTKVFTLNKEFGWICGIYLADGSLSGNVVRISKIAPIVESKLKSFAKVHNIPFKTRSYKGQYGPSKDNILESKELKQFLSVTFGEDSFNKNIGSLVYGASLEFIQGIVSGFFDGDGNVSVTKQLIRASSRSKTLLQGINRLLGYCSMFGVLGEETSVRIPDAVQYTLTIPRKFAGHYERTIGFHLTDKAKALSELVKYTAIAKHSKQEMIDKIPELGNTIARVGKLLGLPGQSRTYGRWIKKESIGRQTLESYVATFNTEISKRVEKNTELASSIALLESALAADVFWDEITDLVYLDDPKTYVYDFTVPGNDSFMVDDSILVHNTLNTFHLAGVAAKSGMTRGVPRLKEVFKVTKSPKATSLSIFLKPEFRDDKEKAREVAQDLELTMLRDIVTTIGLYYDPKDEATVVEEDRELLAFYKLFEQRESGASDEPTEVTSPYGKWMLRLEFNKSSMFNRNITMDDVAYILTEKFGSTVGLVYTDFNSQKLIMRIRLDKEIDNEADDYTNFKRFQARLLMTVAVRGVPGIKAASFSKVENRVEIIEGVPTKISEYSIDTDGSNFIEVMNHPAVDPTRLYTTNVHDVMDVLGVEAGRNILLTEIESLFADAGVNYRHLGLLIDSMTRNGRLMSVDRYGINKNNIGPLAKASFEETEKILLRAALFGEMDPVTGVSAKIMTGQTMRGGTTFSQLLLDEAVLLRLQKGLPPVADEEEEDVEELDEDDIAEELATIGDDRCNAVRLRMNTVMPEGDMDLEEPDVVFNVLE